MTFDFQDPWNIVSFFLFPKDYFYTYSLEVCIQENTDNSGYIKIYKDIKKMPHDKNRVERKTFVAFKNSPWSC